MWWATGVPDEETAHLRLIRRWLRGEVVNNHVGIRVRGGPFDGRIRIMPLDESGRPPARTRSRRSGQVWHVYTLVADANETSSWAYVYEGVEPVDAPAPECGTAP
jgi:hypothetical protein